MTFLKDIGLQLCLQGQGESERKRKIIFNHKQSLLSSKMSKIVIEAVEKSETKERSFSD